MLNQGDLLNIGYYDYGKYFTGSVSGIRFRVGRNPLEAVNYIPKDKRSQASLLLTIWPEPFNFESTQDELKKDYSFDYSNDGLASIIEFLNKECIKWGH